MSDMIEKVARAILALVPEGYGMTKAEASDYARSAIEALPLQEARYTLTQAREKLTLYRAQHSGEYIGGLEYVMLIDRIDATLAALNDNPAAP